MVVYIIAGNCVRRFEMNCENTIGLALAVLLTCSLNCVCAENIDPNNDGSQYAYGESISWVNFEPNLAEPNVGGTASDEKMTGFVWAENIGWISLSCENTLFCGTVDYGVTNDGAGNLSGYAWSENAGWISFSCENAASCGTVDYRVTIDADGVFAGYAWGENIGWINFNSANLFGYNAQACKVEFVDLANFVDDWLQGGAGVPGDLDDSNDVDFLDYGVFASYWLTFCPSDWGLK
jgi:hypothetical protein